MFLALCELIRCAGRYLFRGIGSRRAQNYGGFG